MSLEQILEKAAAARAGYEIASFKEAGLPVYVLTARVLILERKPLGPIEEALLRAADSGLGAVEDFVRFLGLPVQVLTPVLAGMNTAELINYSRQTGSTSAKVTLAAKGRAALADAAVIRPRELSIKFCLDGLTKKVLFVAPEMLYRPRDMRDLGFFEVPTGSTKRPELEDVPLQDFDKVLSRQSSHEESRAELLSVRRIDRRELAYQGCVMVYYRSLSDADDIEVAFWREDGPALEHEEKFRSAGGPELVGARVLTVPSGTAEVPSPTPEISIPDKSSTKVNSKDGGERTVEGVRCHEHPALLQKALTESRKRLLIISPWITDKVVTWDFVSRLENLLRRDVLVYIGYGIGDHNANKRPDMTARAEKELKYLEKYKNFRLVCIGNTHRKFLVSDDFAVNTSFNWLSFRGDPREPPRDEKGWLLRKKEYVDEEFNEGLTLLDHGYSGR